MIRADLLKIPRSAIQVAYVLKGLPPEGATYRGLAAALGMRSESGIRKAVHLARLHRLVRVIQTGQGKGALAVIRLLSEARKVLA